MLRTAARPEPCRLPLLADPDNDRAQIAAALRETADAPLPGEVAGIGALVAALGQSDEAARVLALLEPVLSDLLGGAGAETVQRAVASSAVQAVASASDGAATAVAAVAAALITEVDGVGATLARRVVGAAQVRQVAAQVRCLQARQAYRLTADPLELPEPNPPGAWVTLRGIADWRAVEAAARASIPPSPALGELVAQRVHALAQAAALASGGDLSRAVAEHLDRLTPHERAARDAYDAWLRRYYMAMAERVILAIDGGLPDDLPAEVCTATAKAFPAAAFAKHVEADGVFAEAVELCRTRYSAGKAPSSRASASGRGAPSGSAPALQGGRAHSAPPDPA